MRLINLILLSASLALGSIKFKPIIPIASFADDFDYLFISPIKAGEVYINYRLSLSTKTSLPKIYSVDLMDNGVFQKNLLKSSFTSTGYSGEETFTVNYSNTQSLHFYVKIGRLTQTFEKTVDIKMADYHTIYVDDLEKEYTTSENIYEYYHLSGTKYLSESIRLDTYISDYSIPTYHAINLKDYKYTYTFKGNNKARENCQGSFSMISQKDVLGNLSFLYEGEYCLLIHLVGEYNDETKQYGLVFSDSLFVDPLTLDMSNSELEGYVATDNFFFPSNTYDYLNEFFCGYYIFNIGFNATIISGTLDFHPPLDLLGDCSSSLYCVSSSNEEPDFELGESIVHS